MILAIETATPVCSVAFKKRNRKQFEERIVARGSHSEKLFTFIKELMNEHQFKIKDLSAILVSEGPGSYTGLRIAASGVKGLLFGSEVPLYSVSTLASFSVAAHRQLPDATTIHTIIDAKRKHLYRQIFSFTDAGIEAANNVDIIPIETVEKMIEPDDVIIGTGLERIDESTRNKAHCLSTDFISARSLINLYHQNGEKEFIEKVSPAAFDPNYFTTIQN